MNTFPFKGEAFFLNVGYDPAQTEQGAGGRLLTLLTALSNVMQNAIFGTESEMLW
jgi:hypothetical protein